MSSKSVIFTSCTSYFLLFNFAANVEGGRGNNASSEEHSVMLCWGSLLKGLFGHWKSPSEPSWRVPLSPVLLSVIKEQRQYS